MSGEQRKYLAKKQCLANPWWCTCRAVWPLSSKGGNPHHDGRCPREKWAKAAEADREAPTVGMTLTAMPTAGPRTCMQGRWCVAIGRARMGGL